MKISDIKIMITVSIAEQISKAVYISCNHLLDNHSVTVLHSPGSGREYYPHSPESVGL